LIFVKTTGYNAETENIVLLL